MAIGGFNGTDPWPTLGTFQAGGGQSFGGGQGSSAIAAWVAANFKKETAGGQTVYDLTQPGGG